MSDFWKDYEPEPTRAALMTTDEDQIIKSTLSAFGPDEGVTFTQDTWAKLHAAMSAVVAQPAPVQKPVAITEQMAFAFHNAITDGAIGTDDLMDIMRGLEAAFAHIIAPPAAQRQWVGLTDEEIEDIVDQCDGVGWDVGWAINVKLKERNV